MVQYAIKLGNSPASLSYISGYGAVVGSSYSFSYNLEAETVYYWQVFAQDDRGLITAGPIWSFTTAYAYPDVAITAFTVDGTIKNDSAITLNVTIVNQGNFVASGGTLRFYPRLSIRDEMGI